MDWNSTISKFKKFRSEDETPSPSRSGRDLDTAQPSQMTKLGKNFPLLEISKQFAYEEDGVKKHSVYF
jgi:hypothetical protein